MPKNRQFFQPQPNLQKAITLVKVYQTEIDKQRENKEKLEALLKKNLSPVCRERVNNRVQSLRLEIDHHQDELLKMVLSQKN